MIPIIAVMGAACAALLASIATAIAVGGGDPELPHPGFGDLPPDEPADPTPTTYLHITPAGTAPDDLADHPGRHRAPEPGRVPAELASYATWVAAGMPTRQPQPAGWWAA